MSKFPGKQHPTRSISNLYLVPPFASCLSSWLLVCPIPWPFSSDLKSATFPEVCQCQLRGYYNPRSLNPVKIPLPETESEALQGIECITETKAYLWMDLLHLHQFQPGDPNHNRRNSPISTHGPPKSGSGSPPTPPTPAVTELRLSPSLKASGRCP